MAGQTVSVTKPVNGELFAIGSSLSITGLPNRSTFLAGKDISDTAGSGYDLFSLGENVNLNGTYNHTVYVAGNTITLSPQTVIHGDLYIFAASQVNLAGTIDGDVHITTGALATQKLHIAHDLWYTADQSTSSLNGQVAGSIHYSKTPQPSKSSDPMGWIIALFAMILTAGLLRTIFSYQIGSVLHRVRTQYTASYGWGSAFIIIFPIVITLLFSILITYKVAIIALALYTISLVIAGNLGALLIGEYVLLHTFPNQENHPWLQSVIGSCILIGLNQITGIGIIIGIILFPALVGGQLLTLHNKPAK